MNNITGALYEVELVTFLNCRYVTIFGLVFTLKVSPKTWDWIYFFCMWL